MHSANNRLVDTTTIAPRPPSSLTTELEPCIQSPRNATATQQQNAQCHQRLDDSTTIAPSAAKQLDDRARTPLRSPRHATATQQQPTQCHNNLDDSTTIAPRPPNNDNLCDTTKQYETIRGSSLGTDPLTAAACQLMQVDTPNQLPCSWTPPGHTTLNKIKFQSQMLRYSSNNQLHSHASPPRQILTRMSFSTNSDLDELQLPPRHIIGGLLLLLLLAVHHGLRTLSSSPAEHGTTLLWLFTPLKGPGSEKANFIV